MIECSLNNCQVTNVIKEHVKAIIQIMTNELADYYMQMITTKCLNTAVTLMYIFFGKEALKFTKFCDVRTVNTRREINEGDNFNHSIVSNLKKDVLSKKHQQRRIYYIMLTDGKMKKNKTDMIHFPGHVFLIDKFCSSSFQIYQSYIWEYDLSQGVQHLNHDEMKDMLDQLEIFLNKNIWTRECCKFWKKITNIDVTSYIGYNKHEISLCTRQITAKHCDTFLKKLLNRIKLSIIKENPQEIFGKKSYHKKETPLTNGEMLKEIDAMLNKL